MNRTVKQKLKIVVVIEVVLYCIIRLCLEELFVMHSDLFCVDCTEPHILLFRRPLCIGQQPAKHA